MNVLIISSKKDRASLPIIDWLVFFGVERVFKYTFAELISKKLLTFNIKNISGKLTCEICVENASIDRIWFWRDEQYNPDLIADNPEAQESVKQISQYIHEESQSLRKFMFNDSFVKSIKILSNSSFQTLNKLEVLALANNLRLITPNYLITKSKFDVISFKSKYNRIITKPIHESLFLNLNQEAWSQYTEEVNDDILAEMTNSFYPTLFQELVEKRYEIRSFVLDSKIYSMAIFSQNDDQTSVDFRRYNPRKWNRNVPYNLPDEVENKLLKLMHSLQLNTGSIDLVRDHNGRYVFLEVNPNGQFGMVSHPCNYNLEMKIAEAIMA